ncbi:MAG: CbtA family protein [Micropruina sp.]|uniref:CbtA family protein n=1 Tax=Micropruina sp. TaxID=2737536 RepID=UPI0039E48CB8
MLTLRNFLVRGLLAGLLAGLAAFVVGYVVGEPPVAASIAIEEEGGGHSHETEAQAPAPAEEEDPGTEVPRDLQSTIGLATGMLVLGTALGGLAGIMTGAAFGRFGRHSARSTALAVAGTAFTVLYVVPYLIYPPNPPAVGHGETIGYRTGLYFAMLAISVLAAALALYLGRRLQPNLGGWYAGLVGVGVYLVIVLVGLGLMPRYDEVPEDFPATLLYQFRQASVVTQAVLWGVIGVVLGELTHRLAVKGRPRSAAQLTRVG